MRRSPTLLCALLLLALAPAAVAQVPGQPGGGTEVKPQKSFPTETAEAGTHEGTPWILRWMIHPLHRGMFVAVPVIDTDPNRGVSAGLMPIWVFQEKEGTRIEQIHAPSLTYNGNFGFTPCYRYYYYPSFDQDLQARADFNNYEKEGLLQYEDRTLRETNFDFYSRFWYNVDASQRFFGFGPDSPKSAESNYKEDFLMYRVMVGHPLTLGSAWRAHLSSHLQSQKTLNGPLHGLPSTNQVFPQVASPDHRQQVHEVRLTLDYDTRDYPVTTTQGVYAMVFAEHATKGFASQYDYGRYGVDGRFYHPEPWLVPTVTAAQAQLQQVTGNAPFWAQSTLGGKYSLRAYGVGRYVDRGVAALNVEQRFQVYATKLAGVTTELELAPFAGAGEVFDNPGRAAARYVRPVVGSAVRVVCKPQVVGSLDLGVGREGMKAFIDINYSF